MIADLVATIDIHIAPQIFESFLSLTWHGFFTAVGIALGVWLSLRLARGAGISQDDAMTIALVGVPSGVVGARALWVLEHTDRIDDVGDIFALTDGGISVYGAMIGGVVGAFLFIVFFKPDFPKWIALDVAAPGMILGQAVGRIGDFINGEHFAKASDLPWAFRYTHPQTDGPWASFADGAPVGSFVRGDTGTLLDGQAVAVHPVAGGYEPLLALLILGVLLLLRRQRVLPGWSFVFYVVSYAAVRGLLALLRTDEQDVIGGLSVPQLLAVLTALAAAAMAFYLLRHPQPRLTPAERLRAGRREEARQRREEGRTLGDLPRAAASGPGQVRVRKYRRRRRR